MEVPWIFTSTSLMVYQPWSFTSGRKVTGTWWWLVSYPPTASEPPSPVKHSEKTRLLILPLSCQHHDPPHHQPHSPKHGLGYTETHGRRSSSSQSPLYLY